MFLMVDFLGELFYKQETKASKRSSFEKVEKWITENEKCDIPVKVLVGNKV